MKVRLFSLLVTALFFGVITKLDIREMTFELKDSSPPIYVSIVVIIIFSSLIILDVVLEMRKIKERKETKLLETIMNSDMSKEFKEEFMKHHLKDY